MNKLIPIHWTIQQLAYFAGLLSASLGLQELFELLHEINRRTAESGRQTGNAEWFLTLLENIKSRITVAQWEDYINTVERIWKVE